MIWRGGGGTLTEAVLKAVKEEEAYKVKKAEQNIEKMQEESKRMGKEIPKTQASIETAEKRLAYEKQKMDKILDSHKDELSGHRSATGLLVLLPMSFLARF